jgi:alpha-ketoglutarate-dependent taurine dioxygenase
MPMVTRQVGPCFAAEVHGLDLTRPLSDADVAAIHAAMDTHAVLVFHDQKLDDEQQLAFTRSLGEIEHAIGTSLRAADELRLPTTFADVSNLDKDHQVFVRDDRRRLFGLGNRLWHSDSSFKVVPAKYSLLHARSVPPRGGNTEFADMRAAYEALDDETQKEVEDLICEHSQIFSRQQLGFTDFTDEERERFQAGTPAPGPHASVHAAQVALPRLARGRHRGLAGAGGARVPARSRRARDAAGIRLRPPLARQRPGDVGQPRDDAPGAPVPRPRAA